MLLPGLTYVFGTVRRGTVRGAASGTENVHRHLKMNAYTSVGILLNCPLEQTALLFAKFQVFKTTLFFFYSASPQFCTRKSSRNFQNFQ